MKSRAEQIQTLSPKYNNTAHSILMIQNTLFTYIKIAQVSHVIKQSLGMKNVFW